MLAPLLPLFSVSLCLCGEKIWREKRARETLLPGPMSLETRVKPENCYSSAKCRRVTEPILTSPAASSIRERGGLGVLSGRNAEDIKMTERTSMTPLKALASISSFLSPVTRATTLPQSGLPPTFAASRFPPINP